MKDHSMQIEARSTIQTKTDRGMQFCQNFSIANTGIEAKRSAVYFWLEVTEPSFFSLIEWHSFSPASPVHLEVGETRTITLNFDIPAHAAPGTYHYTIAYKSEQNIEKTIRCPLQLEVPSMQQNRFKKTLNFSLDPATTSESPYLLQPGESVTFTLNIENRSAISDLIYLNCSELLPEWFTIEYLNREANPLGVVQPVKGLRLEAQESGEIQFTFHPPIGTAAGNYFPTLQLISMNSPDLLTLDVIYVQVLPDTRLETELIPKVRSIPQEFPTFTLRVRNRGNVERKLKLETRGSEQRFQFVTETNTVTIAPNRETAIVLQAVPRNRWQRPWWGKPLRSAVSFHLIPTDGISDPPYPPQAKLIWLPQPKWVLAALMLMGTGTVLLLLSLLYRFNRQPSTTADIIEFSPTKRTYLEGASNAVRLNWTVRNPEMLDRLVIAQLNEGAEIQTKAYRFSTAIPKELQAKTEQENGCRHANSATPVQSAPVLWELPLPELPWLSSLQQPAKYSKIECQGIPFVSSQSGAFKYKLKLFDKSDARVPIAEAATDTVTVKSTGSSQSPEQSAAFIPRSFDEARKPEIVAFTLNGQDAMSQLTHTFTVGTNEVANVEVSWAVQGEAGLEVELLPFTGLVKSQGSINYPIAPGNVKTLTLTARSRSGAQVTQSVDIQVVVGDRPRPTRSPIPRSTPEPTPTQPPTDVAPEPPTPTEEPTPEPTPTSTPEPSPTETPSPQP
ncbi:COG1470 family protein [Leptolyngbya sp. NIES-2104]|uniref:COG1470 family protein n=1 Tax=Leptolyngbya sp. NIES-2104 TaxID=1552121 RepID=UPI000A890BDC|nr:hypothetical protein [Leptolyngbya sp. NIES-2104]